jgi:hypothetical protein
MATSTKVATSTGHSVQTVVTEGHATVGEPELVLSQQQRGKIAQQQHQRGNLVYVLAEDTPALPLGSPWITDLGYRGVLRYVGVPEDLGLGEFCGLELEPGLGVSDGTFHGVRLFTCAAESAVFLRRNELHAASSASSSVAAVDQFPSPSLLKTLVHLQRVARGAAARRRVKTVRSCANGAGDFEAVDKWARLTPEKEATSIEGLAAYLSQKAESDLERARAAYTWVATHVSYDVKMCQSKHITKQDSADVLKSRKAICMGYSNTFKDLAEKMNLKAEYVRGWSKGYGFVPGVLPKGRGHTWNAVKIGQDWGLLDVTWGAGHMNGTTFVRNFDAFDFLTPPDLFLQRHIPHEEEWQLVPEPVSVEAWTNIPIMNLAAKYGVGLLSHKEVLITTTESNLEIQLSNPKEVEIFADLELKKRSKKQPFVTDTTAGGVTTLMLKLPVCGKYQLDCDVNEKVEGGYMIWTILSYCIKRVKKEEE